MRYLVTCPTKLQAFDLYMRTVKCLYGLGYHVRYFERHGDTWIIDIVGTGNDIVFVGDTRAIDHVKEGFRGKVYSHRDVNKWLDYQRKYVC